MVNPLLISPPPPPLGGLFISNAFGGELNRDGGLIREGGSFNLTKMMVSVLHKELRIQSGKSQIQEVGGHAAEDQKQIRTSSSFQLVNKLSQISPH